MSTVENSSEPVAAVDVSADRMRRRPSGEAPPLPRPLRYTGLVMIFLTGLIVIAYAVLLTITNAGHTVVRFDEAILEWTAQFRSPAATSVAQNVNDWLVSVHSIRILRWMTVLALLAFRRFRHLFVYMGAVLAVGFITTQIALGVVRPRPLGVEILAQWEGSAHPSRPLAALAVTLLGILYTLLVAGRPRNLSKFVVGGLLLLAAGARLYLAIDSPVDVVVGLVIGVTISVVAFRLLTPNDVFPVGYKGGRTAHLDVGGERGAAIRKAMQEQLGLTILDMKPVGLEGSGGSTPLRLKVASEEGKPESVLFAKLYAQNHLRADRWYKVGRILLYGRLEDESSFSTVRRLIQYEDHMLRFMRDAGVNVPRPFGFVEITPEREYLLVTDFVDDAKEIREAEVNDAVIDEGLLLIRQLWDAGVAHRDIKPSNLLVRTRQIYVIDVAFAEIRPSPWRQAVDLANMMIVLALRSDADRVYRRALRFFAPSDISEAFAATHGVTMPSQSRSMLKRDKRDIVRRFRELAPDHPSISVQRWSARRAGLWLACLLGAFLAVSMAVGNLPGAGLVTPQHSSEAGLAAVVRAPECGRVDDSIILEAQSVPSAASIPCVKGLPVGWRFRTMTVEASTSKLFFAYDRPNAQEVVATFTKSCLLRAATEVQTDKPGTTRFEEVRALGNRYVGSRFYVFEGGCLEIAFDFRGTIPTVLADEVSSGIDLTPRSAVVEDLRKAGISL